MKGKVLMSQKQISRYVVVQRSLEGAISVRDAAAALNLSTRQVIRLRNGVRENGALALVHKNQGRQPAHAVTDDLRKRIVALKVSDQYKNANFKHFQELLDKHESITVSYSLLYRVLTQAGIQSPKKRRRFKPHWRRSRKAQEGLLLQMDASPFQWFGGRRMYALHGSIDDATGKITGLYITKNECLQGYFEVARQTMLSYGIPVSIYSDRHAIFLSTKAGKLTIEEQLEGKVCNDTQFGRAMKELGVTIIYARSPQAKGRIERLWGTLQSRLPVEFQIAGIDNINAANEFLKEYIPEFNKLFAVGPSQTESAFRPLGDVDINSVLCVKQKRKVDSGGVFSFYGKHFKVVTEKEQPPIPTRTQITVCINSITGVRVEYNGRVYETVPFIKPKKNVQKNTTVKKRKYASPPDTHYYKYGKYDQSLFPRISFEESDQEILGMLQKVFLGKYKDLTDVVK
jgi:transposase